MAESEPQASPAAQAPLGRQLIVCCDGTNNTLTGETADTNVLQLHRYLVDNPAPGGIERILFYDPGVGSPDAVPPTDPIDWVKRSWERTSGLASGRGIYDNIGDAYLFLMRHWRGPEDRIYCFGFSRGAFTARCVVGMVHLFGIIEPQHEAMVPTLIRIYFSLPSGQGRWWQKATARTQRVMAKQGVAGRPVPVEGGRDRLALQVRTLFATAQGRSAWVHWVGVWDTVESVGLPGPLSRSNPSTATFVDKRVRHVRHALAFDEHRWTFLPRLYEVPGDVTLPDGRTLRQRWFRGVHCDVGGGYATDEQGLSGVALRWMVNEAAAELQLPAMPPPTAPSRALRHDALYETPWWALAGMCVRDMRPHTRFGPRVPVHPPVRRRSDEAIAVVPFDPSAAPDSVWDRRRPLWPVALAIAIGLACLFLSGKCLLPVEQRWSPFFGGTLEKTLQFAWKQLQALWGCGLLGMQQRPWQLQELQPGWAMFWDFAFIGAYGYVLSRIASRAFTWMAGSRAPGQARSRWLLLGMAPLAMVGGDAAENLCTLLAMGAHGLGVDVAGVVLLFVGGIGSLAKFVGFACCLPLVAVRLGMVVAGKGRLGAVR